MSLSMYNNGNIKSIQIETFISEVKVSLKITAIANY